ncbi:Hypothetical protein R9X50_00690800 [Acrodontium crateriforme]|uniref:Uncharacterized protein n=1 Tax=Acrodontium crateriforme TaxID=150365 RepID=A0AAQ3M9B8_9PEZI|nr:Hypothetical protein R9X50_00690800 [Acrodontium crateriforme]
MTTTTTSYLSEIVINNSTLPVTGFLQNGTLIQGPPPSTTQVAYVTLSNNSTVPVTYPTHYRSITDTALDWGGVLGYTSNDMFVCTSVTNGPSPLPPHGTPFPAGPSALDPVDPNDQYGNFYTLDFVDQIYLLPSDIQTLWPSNSQILAIYSTCGFDIASPVQVDSTVSALLETITSHISKSATSLASPASSGALTTASATSSTTELPSSSTETSSGALETASATSSPEELPSSSTETSSAALTTASTISSLTELPSSSTETSSAQQFPS